MLLAVLATPPAPGKTSFRFGMSLVAHICKTRRKHATVSARSKQPRTSHKLTTHMAFFTSNIIHVRAYPLVQDTRGRCDAWCDFTLFGASERHTETPVNANGGMAAWESMSFGLAVEVFGLPAGFLAGDWCVQAGVLPAWTRSTSSRSLGLSAGMPEAVVSNVSGHWRRAFGCCNQVTLVREEGGGGRESMYCGLHPFSVLLKQALIGPECTAGVSWKWRASFRGAAMLCSAVMRGG